MGIISIEQNDCLYWLGRYTERVYTTLRLFAKHFDLMIDAVEDSYEDFCRNLDIPNIYISKEDFVKRYCFDGTDTNSIYSNLIRGYDNAIVLREELGSETLSYIQLAVYELQKAKDSAAPLIYMQKVMDNIVAFWGMADDSIDKEEVRNILKVGRRVERTDLYARLKMPKTEMVRSVARLSGRIARSGMKYKTKVIENLNELVLAPELDYNRIINEVESILED